MKRLSGIFLWLAVSVLLASCGTFPHNAPVQERSPVISREGLPRSGSASGAGSSGAAAASRNPDKPPVVRPPSGSAIAGLAPPQPAPGVDDPVAVATPLRSEGSAAPARAAAASPGKPSLALAAPSSAVAGLPALDWMWPVDTPMTQTYSESSKGVDFTGVLGQPVRAAAAGEVAYVTNSLRGYGLMVVVRHDKGYLSVYAHNRRVVVKEGQRVERGQRIAEMGSSDNKDAVLHFELRHQGRPLDPVQVFPGR